VDAQRKKNVGVSSVGVEGMPGSSCLRVGGCAIPGESGRRAGATNLGKIVGVINKCWHVINFERT